MSRPTCDERPPTLPSPRPLSLPTAAGSEREKGSEETNHRQPRQKSLLSVSCCLRVVAWFGRDCEGGLSYAIRLGRRRYSCGRRPLAARLGREACCFPALFVCILLVFSGFFLFFPWGEENETPPSPCVMCTQRRSLLLATRKTAVNVAWLRHGGVAD